MKTRGKGFKKEIWFSLCSKHYNYNENCDLCNSGSWINSLKYKIESIIYYISPSFWKWYVNKF